MSRKMKTKAGNPIIMVPTMVNGKDLEGDPFIKPDKIPLAIVNKNGVVYKIPVDPKTGKVPESALYSRFLDEYAGAKPGHKRNINIDLAKYAEKMNNMPKGGYTPEELLKTGWWEHPQNSDILGIDDPSTSVLTIVEGASKSGQEAGKKIAIIAPPESRERIQKVLRDNFTGTELKRAVADRGIIIREGNAGSDASGFYRFRQPFVDVPEIVLMRGADEDTITHEFTHHMRHTDPTRTGVSRTPFPLDEDGKVDIYLLDLNGDLKSVRNLEEAATVAEAATRTREACKAPTGYYLYVPNGSGHVKEYYDHDRDILTKTSKGDNKPKRGKNATKKVEKEFGNTKISELQYKGGKKAKDVYELKKEMLNKPIEKKKSLPVEDEGIPSGGPRPMATANVRSLGSLKSGKKSMAKKPASTPAKKPTKPTQSYKYAVDSKGKRHRVPVNKDGTVSKRYLNEQAKKGAKNLNMDKKRTSKTVLPSNPTPQMAYDWSKNVSNMDVNGLDAPRKARISYNEKKTKGKRR